MSRFIRMGMARARSLAGHTLPTGTAASPFVRQAGTVPVIPPTADTIGASSAPASASPVAGASATDTEVDDAMKAFAEDLPYPPNPAAHAWSDKAVNTMKSLEEHGYTLKRAVPNPHSFVSGGYRPDRRIRFQFFYKPGPAAQAAAGAGADGSSGSVRPNQAMGSPAGLEGPAALAHMPSLLATPSGSGAGSGAAAPSPSSSGTAQSHAPSPPIPSMPTGLLAGVVHFGPDCVGPPQCVHGGAIAAAADSAMGQAYADVGPAMLFTCARMSRPPERDCTTHRTSPIATPPLFLRSVWYSNMASVTASMTVNYKKLIRTCRRLCSSDAPFPPFPPHLSYRLLPVLSRAPCAAINSTIFTQVEVHRAGRKAQVAFSFWNIDRTVLHAEGSGMFLTPRGWM